MTDLRTLLDSLIDEEIELYRIHGYDSGIAVGIKLMADAIREKYDLLEQPKQEKAL